MDTLKFDELNKMRKMPVPYSRYFGEMALTEEQKKKRIDFSEQIEELMLFLFYLFENIEKYGYSEKDFVVSQIVEKYKSVIEKYANVDSYIEQYVNDFSENIVKTTQNHSSDGYYTSNDRAMFVAENEANTVLNYIEFAEAIKQGKTLKRWITMHDEKVRETHVEVNDRVIGIRDLYLVGAASMRFPKDTLYGALHPEEIINCRCTIQYF